MLICMELSDNYGFVMEKDRPRAAETSNSHPYGRALGAGPSYFGRERGGSLTFLSNVALSIQGSELQCVEARRTLGSTS